MIDQGMTSMRANQAHEGQRFEIVRPLGSGGFGAVYEAFDCATEQRVALKELTRVSPSALVRFKQEFRTLSDVHHPNLVRLKELIEQEGRWYIVMELVEGKELLSFVQCSDNEPCFDEGRLRTAFIGVAEALEALHAHGILHRDLKPSNVLVTPEGRAVLLDFGLVTSVDSVGQSTHAAAVGTVLYMAPEQADGQKLGRPADWYAFGASLYQALTGRPPFEGDSAVRVALQKLHGAPPHPNTLVDGLPQDLSELCMRLLRIAPQDRPTGREVLQVLRGEGARDSLPSTRPQSLVPARVFAGRESEMDHLERALSRTHDGELRIVLVEGESGVGKSELVAEFLRRQEQQNPRTMALRGRCYENEQVSYKAFDGCIDELARHLRHMGKDAAVLMPAHAPLLAQLFPVLADVPALVRGRSTNVAADPTARRLQAFAALSALLGNLAEERPLIVVIDDLQWADSESFRLLRALVEDPAKPPILVLATVRPREELEGEVLTSLTAVRTWNCTEVVSLYGLPKPQAEALAQALLGASEASKWASIIATESRGHPLFLAELIHFSRSRDLSAQGMLTLDAALEARIERLDRHARAVLEVVALAARPHSPQLFARALRVSSIDASVTTLLGRKLLRSRREREIGCYHDRIRQVAAGLIPNAQRPLLHRKLAEALAEEPFVDATEEAAHWDLAGDPERALDAYTRAAEQAMTTLAFTQAERLFTRAIELAQGPQHPQFVRLTSARAQALACAGRSAEAATLYQRAAELATDDEQRLRLQSRTAFQLLASGNLETGLEACRALFARIGVRMPKSDLGGLVVALWHRLWTRFPKHGALPACRNDRQTRLVLELLQEHAPTLGAIQISASLAVGAQYARIALAYGDRQLASTAYLVEGWLVNARSGIKSATTFFEVARKLATLPTPNTRRRAELAATEGSARLGNWQWSQSIALLEEAEHLYETEIGDDPWALTVVRYHLGLVWYRTGDHAQLARKMEAWIHEARERKDPFAVALLSGMGLGAVRHLMRGDVEGALGELNANMANLPARPFSFAHFGHMMGMQYALSIQGGRSAWDWFAQRRRQHEGALLLKTSLGKGMLPLLRSQSALRALEVAKGSEREALIKFVRKSAATLQKRDSHFTRSFAALFTAQLSALGGRPEEALQLARKARLGFDGIGDACAHAAAYLEGTLQGGEQGKARRAEVARFYEKQGWLHPENAVLIHLPTLPLLSEAARSQSRAGQLFIQHYQILSRLGSGGFGGVVEARDTRSGESVALKELVSKSAHALERFKQEFRALRDLHHRNLVRFDALFEDQGRWYIAMELVRGQDLVSYVRPDGKLDTKRLCTAFAGLLAGLQTLHQAGLVHRDVSPENVCVTAEGRAVLLDFGLVARAHDARDAEAVGNADYAPPEQLEGVPPHAAADAYAVGVCLYQALTGQLPFETVAAHAIRFKRMHKPRAPVLPSELDPLAACCLRLMSAEPSERPSLRELGDVLTSAASLSNTVHRASLSPGRMQAEAGTFAGRRMELAALQKAQERARASFTFVLVEGESGLGKSALVSEFAQVAESQAPDVWSLGGRCDESEQLSLKAFDGVVDELARKLRKMPQADCEELLPKKAALLAQLFPVLGSVPAIFAAPKKGLPADPAARRSLALLVFIELLERLAQRKPLLILIDDLQWADAESLALLHTLSDRGQALPALVVATSRHESEVTPLLRAPIEALKALPSTRTLALGHLLDTDARALAALQLGPDVPSELFERLAEESQGHPLFLRELAALAKERDVTGSQSPLSLDEALESRITRFDAQTRSLLTLVALAGKPYPSHVFAAAFDDSDAILYGSANELLNHGLLRRRSDTGLACNHDRIRQVAIAMLAGDARKALCAKLAQALDVHQPAEAAERARLWDEAGNEENALAAHEQAGDAALEKLAFAQAEQHYARALALGGTGRDARWQRLTIQRAHALSRAGRTAQAAEAYKAAAESARGELAVRLRVSAAQEMLKSAQVEEGLAASSALLSELGEPLPEHDRAAMRRIVWDRLCVRMGGLEPRVQKPKAADESEGILLDALRQLNEPLQWVSFLGASALTMNYLRRALRRGDPRHAAIALATEGLLRASRWRSDWGECFERSRELLEVVQEPELAAAVNYSQGAAHLTWFHFKEARLHLETAHKLAEEHCQGQRWLLTRTRATLGTVLWWTRRHRLFAGLMRTWIDEAKALNDKFAVMALCSLGCGSLRFLMDDAPDKAADELQKAMEPWPKEPFGRGQWGALYCQFATHFYVGGRGGYDWYHEQKRLLTRQVIVKQGFSRPTVLAHYGRLTLHAIERLDAPNTRALLEEADPSIRAQRKHRSPWFRAAGEELASISCALRGEREHALEHARANQTEHTMMPEPDPWQRAEYLLATLEGGPLGKARCQNVLESYASEGWRNPARAISMYLPCLGLITQP